MPVVCSISLVRVSRTISTRIKVVSWTFSSSLKQRNEKETVFGLLLSTFITSHDFGECRCLKLLHRSVLRFNNNLPFVHSCFLADAPFCFLDMCHSSIFRPSALELVGPPGYNRFPTTLTSEQFNPSTNAGSGSPNRLSGRWWFRR